MGVDLLPHFIAALSTLRGAAESLMTTQWRITRQTGEITIVDYQPTAATVIVYHGRGKLQTYEGHEQTLPAGPSTVVQQRMTIHLPVGSYSCLPGDIAECVGSTDVRLVGRKWRIVQAYPVKEHATSYRVFADELIEG